MKNKRFSKFGDVFTFTFKEQAKSKSFIVTTVIVPLVLFAVLFAVSFLMAFLSGEKEYFTEKIYVIDETGYSMAASAMSDIVSKNDRFDKAEIVTSDKKTAEEICDAMSNEEIHSVVLSFNKDAEKNTFSITLTEPKWCDLSDDETDDILDMAKTFVTGLKVTTSGIDIQTVTYLSSMSSVLVHTAGEPGFDANSAVKMIVPMLVALIMYMMLMLYGQGTGKVVALEKNSKLMEYMLTAVHPDSLVSGKVLAISIQSIMQIALWVVGGVAGFKVGELVGKVVAPDYENVISEFLNAFSQGTTAFTPLSIAIAAFTLVLGIILFGFMAGLFGSLVSKPEELANTMGLFNFVVMIGFFCSYFPAMGTDATIKNIVRIIPLTSVFILPGDIAVGNADYLVGGIGVAVLLLSCIAMAVICGHVYKSKVFNNGKTSKLTEILGRLGRT